DDVFGFVRARVDAASGGKQLPWTHTSVVGQYYFVPDEMEKKVSAEAGMPLEKVKAALNPKDSMRYVYVPPGSFIMGCSPGDGECNPGERPPHQVTISKGFWIGETEVTVTAYKRYASENGKVMPPEPVANGRALNPGWAQTDQPISNVTWFQARD